MNHNCTCGTTSNAVPKLPVRLFAIPRAKQAVYVESVCAVLIESRFGFGRASQLVVNLGDRPETEQLVFFELTDRAMVPFYSLSPVGRRGFQVVEAEYRKAKQMGIARLPRRAHTPSRWLARGSP